MGGCGWNILAQGRGKWRSLVDIVKKGHFLTR